MIIALWTWRGSYFGYRRGDFLWTKKGEYVGRFFGNEVYTAQGVYLGEMIRNRLFYQKAKKQWTKTLSAPYTPAVDYTKITEGWT